MTLYYDMRYCILLLLHIKQILYMQVGDESFESYSAEKDGILSSLARRAKVSKLMYTINFWVGKIYIFF